VTRWRKVRLVAGLFAVAPVVFFAVAAALTPLPRELASRGAPGSVRVEDRDGTLLRDVRADDGSRSRWTPLAEMGDALPAAVIAAEDSRFRLHVGVDPLSVVRAAVQAVYRRRIVSGASTLTMQLARTVRPHKRNLWGKLGEMALALRIERSLSKERILEEYMNRVSFGPNLRGVAAASQAYFGKSPPSLSFAEAALVAGMARGPSLYDVTKRPELARARRDRVLSRMVNGGVLPSDQAARAALEPVVAPSRRASFGAPHLVAALLEGDLTDAQEGLRAALAPSSPIARVRTTVELALQRAAETEVARVVAELGPRGVTAASALVVDNATGDVLAYVGSPDFSDARGGQNDGVRALRQPGSTLKPLLYELAMETLGWDASTVLPDVEMHLDVGAVHDYAPRDYDGHVRGPVRLREALGNSLNIPAVWTAHAVGPAPFLDRLHALGFRSLHEDAEFYGPALALGDGEVTLLELARAYATLARGGLLAELRFVSEVEGVDGAVTRVPVTLGRRVMPESLADLVTDILKDHDAREASFGERSALDLPFAVAAKTGTSKGFRDNWTVGYTRALTVAVWVGNFDGAPMTHVSGITGAGPLFRGIMEAAVDLRRDARDPGLPLGAGGHEGLVRERVCALSGELAGPSCPHAVLEWRRDDADRATCTMHESARIDRQNGLRAGKGCGGGDVVTQVYERFPADFTAWAREVGRPVAPLEWSPRCGEPDVDVDDAGDLRIAFPLSGARYVVDPDTPRELQRLEVQIVAPRGVKEVALRVDGHDVARVGPPFAVSWPLAGGEHELVATSGATRSPVVRLFVRDDERGGASEPRDD
jgi:penicillin-binding protein 1C